MIRHCNNSGCDHWWDDRYHTLCPWCHSEDDGGEYDDYDVLENLNYYVEELSRKNNKSDKGGVQARL